MIERSGQEVDDNDDDDDDVPIPFTDDTAAYDLLRYGIV